MGPNHTPASQRLTAPALLTLLGYPAAAWAGGTMPRWRNTTAGALMSERFHNVTTSAPHESLDDARWSLLGLSVLIFATALGNILVCLAVSWERRLQNMNNYFLMSLAIADLLVALLVMPLAMIVEIYGR